MKMLLVVLMGCGALAWAAGDDGKSPRDATSVAPATAPADSGSYPPGGPRRRLGEGPRPRDFGPPGGPGPRRGERVPPGLDEPLPPKDVDELMGFTREFFPQIHDRLDRLCRENPQEFQRMARRLYGRLKPVIELRKIDPPAAEKAIAEQHLQMEIMGLAEKYRKARSDEERTRLKGQIEARLRERFDRHQERLRLTIERLRRRLDDQERQLAERDRNKEELLRRELDRTLKSPPPPERVPRRPEQGAQNRESPPADGPRTADY